MSEYKTINKPGWWEDEEGDRIKVFGIDGDWVSFLYKDGRGGVRGLCSNINLLRLRHHLTNCNDWDWQPESKVEEIDFPDWILPGWNYVTRDNGNDAPELWCERPAPDADIWNHTLRISSDRTLDFVDTSWVPPMPEEGWERAIWQRKPKTDDGWIEWYGGDCPVSSQVKVEIKKRNGGTCTDIADRFYWHTCYNKPSDIVAYRIVKN